MPGLLAHIEAEIAHLSAREQEILEKLRGRAVITRDVNESFEARRTLGDRVADRVAATMGSWRFIIIQSCLLLVWVALNVTAYVQRWDPYPFILLNLALSFQAAYAAPIIMMSQNRLSARDRLQADHDYETNVKAELEVQEIHDMLGALKREQWEELLDLQHKQLQLLQAQGRQLRRLEGRRAAE